MAKIGVSTQQFIALFDKKRKKLLNFKSEVYSSDIFYTYFRRKGPRKLHFGGAQQSGI